MSQWSSPHTTNRVVLSLSEQIFFTYNFVDKSFQLFLMILLFIFMLYFPFLYISRKLSFVCPIILPPIHSSPTSNPCLLYPLAFFYWTSLKGIGTSLTTKSFKIHVCNNDFNKSWHWNCENMRKFFLFYLRNVVFSLNHDNTRYQ